MQTPPSLLKLKIFTTRAPALSTAQPLPTKDSPPGGRGGAYTPPSAAQQAAVDPFAGVDAFGPAGAAPPSPPPVPAVVAAAAATTTPPPALYGAPDGGAAFGGGGGGAPTTAPVPAAAPPLAFTDAGLPAAAPPTGRVGPASSTPAPSVGRAALLGGNAGGSSAPLGGPGSSTEPGGGGAGASLFSLRRYRRHFNVDTADVLARMRAASFSCVFTSTPDFLDRVSGEAGGGGPDLYGPVWVPTTLVFLSAVLGNLAGWLSWRRAHRAGGGSPPSPDHSAWYYDVDKVGAAAGLVYGYVALGGAGVWGAARWGCGVQGLTLPAVWCAFGYALTPFLPAALAAVIPQDGVRWGAMAAATAVSGAFLVLNFRGVLTAASGEGGAASSSRRALKAAPVLLAMAAAHAGLGLALKLVIFHYWG